MVYLDFVGWTNTLRLERSKGAVQPRCMKVLWRHVRTRFLHASVSSMHHALQTQGVHSHPAQVPLHCIALGQTLQSAHTRMSHPSPIKAAAASAATFAVTILRAYAVRQHKDA